MTSAAGGLHRRRCRVAVDVAARLLVLAALVLATTRVVRAGVYGYRGVVLPPDYHDRVQMGLWAPDDTPRLPGSRRAFVQVNVSVVKEFGSDDAGWLDFVFYHHNMKRYIGYKHDGVRRLCCDRELEQHLGCKLGRVIHSGPLLRSSIWLTRSVHFAPHQRHAQLNDYIEIEDSGLFTADVINCAASNTGSIQLDGALVFSNPFGFLDGRDAGMVPTNVALLVGFALALAVWLTLLARRWRLATPFHHALTAVGGWCVLDHGAALGFEYCYNEHGTLHACRTPMIVAIGLSTTKRATCMVLLLLIAHGYKILRPTLASRRVVALIAVWALAFVAAQVADETMATLRDKEIVQLTSVAQGLIQLPVLILDALLICWVMIVTSRSMRAAKMRAGAHMQRVAQMYRRIMYAIAVCYVVGCVFFATNLGMLVTDSADRFWKAAFLSREFWEIVFLFGYIVFLVIWLPSRTSHAYVYSSTRDDAFDDEIDSMYGDGFGDGSGGHYGGDNDDYDDDGGGGGDDGGGGGARGNVHEMDDLGGDDDDDDDDGVDVNVDDDNDNNNNDNNDNDNNDRDTDDGDDEHGYAMPQDVQVLPQHDDDEEF